MKLQFNNKIVSGVTTGLNSSRPLFDARGELNASSKKDAIMQLAQVLAVLASSETDANTAEINREKSSKRREALTAALADGSGMQMAMLGAAIAARIEETTDRQGFCRQLLEASDLQVGDYPEVTVKVKQVTAYMMSSAAQVVPVEIRDRRLLLNEVDINAHLLISNREIARSNTDLLEEKYEEGLEAIMVSEDRYWKMCADRAAASRYNVQTTNQFTPQFFARLRDLIDREGLPVATCVLSSTLMQDIITGSEFQHVFDPVTQREILETGMIGNLYNTAIYSDHVRQPEFRVLEDGEMYMVAAPINHGVIATRPLNSTPVDQALIGKANKGWFMNQQTCIAVINNKSIIKGHRL